MSGTMEGIAPVLEARRLRKSFGRLPVLQGIDLDLEAARITVLLGANGAGKSTLMRLLAGDLLPDQGVVHVRGVDLRTHPAAARRGLIHVSQSPPLAPFLTTREHAEALISFRNLAPDAAMSQLERVAAECGQIASVEVQYHDAIRQHQRTIGDGQGSLGQMAGHQQRRASAALFAHQLPQGDR